MTNFTIKIISDNVCPWCYIGKRKLDRAIDLHKKVYPNGKDDTFTLIWSPFYLDETLPQQSVPLLDRFVQRFGAERAGAFQGRLRSMGAQEGISFSFAGRIGNTRDSHRLIQLGKTKGPEVQDRVVMELFRDYFEGTADITSHEMLVEVGVKAGLGREEVKEWLETGKGGEEVDAEVQEAKSTGIRGVPRYIIQGKYEVDGAQDPQSFLEVFAKVKDEQQV
ncbi:DSBA-like thioredoxin domain-containing protein [Parachaetomium inaequale]|uniref:DSBA-like thioredoxin domain-containing protein n=1 Tax=Parachaetomium inaequale TaxID=2588326 RepID=A0AAN6PBR7_9PEZI|nr:DSBA-like thioredoxin domain-containing protein [Parachaetomium inaequale]